MSGYQDETVSSEQRVRRLIVGAIAVVAVVAAVAVGPVLSSHVAAEQMYRVSVTQGEVSSVDGGERVSVSLVVSNPTPATVKFPPHGGLSSITLVRDGRNVGQQRGIESAGATVPAGGTDEIELVFEIPPERRDAVRDGTAGVSVVGSLPVTVSGYETSVDVDTRTGAS